MDLFVKTCRLSAAYWRFWLCVSVVYELFLIFILFQVRAFSNHGRCFVYFLHTKPLFLLSILSVCTVVLVPLLFYIEFFFKCV